MQTNLTRNDYRNLSDMTYPIEVKEQAIELRLAGLTLREIGAQLDVSRQIVADWTAEIDDGDAANARQQRIVHMHQEAHLQASERLMDRIDHMEDKDLTRAFSATAQANHGDIRIIQDERKQSSLIDAIRQALRAKQPGELRLALTEHAEHPATNLGLPAISEP